MRFLKMLHSITETAVLPIRTAAGIAVLKLCKIGWGFESIAYAVLFEFSKQMMLVRTYLDVTRWITKHIDDYVDLTLARVFGALVASL